MRSIKRSAAVLGALLLASCASQPMGTTVQVMPGPNKPFQVFAQEQQDCKAYASAQVKGQADAANQMAFGTALLNTGLNAGLGAATGGQQGARVAAANGSIDGANMAAGQVSGAQQSIQQQYDNAYMQCMYAKGDQVPGMAPPSGESEAAPEPAAAPHHHSPLSVAAVLGDSESRWSTGKFGGLGLDATLAPSGPGSYAADIATAGGGAGCSGEVKGTATDQGGGRLAFVGAENGNACHIDIRLLGRNRMSLHENPDCAAFHGGSCEFDGTLKRVN